MTIREKINRRSGIAAAVAAAAILLAVGSMLWPLGSFRSARAYYTADDGKTWFAAPADKLPPFELDGKTAYRCYLWTCDGGKTVFMSHMERFTPAGRKAMEELRQREADMSRGSSMAEMMAWTEVKLPGTGEGGWMNRGDPRAGTAVLPKCPGGGDIEPEPVVP